MNNVDSLYESKKQVYIMMGIPGSGKSSWIRENIPVNAVICSADHFFEDSDGNYNWVENRLYAAHKTCFSKYVQSLDNPSFDNIVVDNTNTKFSFMRDYVVEANKRGIGVNIVAVLAKPEVAVSRNVHGVPHHVIRKMHKQLDNTLKLGFPISWKINKIIQYVD